MTLNDLTPMNKPFCQVVLPLVYDDALSYYEVLEQIRYKINEVISNVDNYDDIIKELQGEIAKLDEYFVKVEEIESKLGVVSTDLTTIKANIVALQTVVADLDKVDKAQQVQIDDLYTQVKNNYSDLIKNINNAYDYIDSKVDGINIEWYQTYIRLQNVMNRLVLELDNKIKDLGEKLDWYIEHTSVDVYNPIAHKRMTFDENNKQAYVDLRDLGMTYAELSARKIPYEVVKNAHWTYRTWATRGRKEVTHSDVNLFSPISGRWTNWGEALSHALGVVYNSMTYAEIEAIGWTYEELSNKTFLDLIRGVGRSRMNYGDLEEVTINGTNLLGF